MKLKAYSAPIFCYKFVNLKLHYLGVGPLWLGLVIVTGSDGCSIKIFILSTPPKQICFDLKANLLDFVLGKAETRTLTRELQAISSLTIAPAAKAAALGGASEPEHSAAAHPCEKSL